MNIVICADKNHYRDWVGKQYRDMIFYICENSKHKITLTFENSIPLDNVDLLLYFTTDICTNHNILKECLKHKVPYYISALDMFYFYDCSNCEYYKQARGFIHLGHASKLLTSYQIQFPEKLVLSMKGRYINPSIYKNYKLEKKYDILMFGTYHYTNKLENHNADRIYKEKWEKHHNETLTNKCNFYPLRWKLYNILIKHTDKYRIRILPSKCIYDAAIANEELSKVINQSWLTVATCSRADIPFAKYFEISASYSGILGNIPSDYNDLFKNIVHVNEWMTEEEIISIIDDALKDKEKLTKNINDLGSIIHSEYDLNGCVKDMDCILDKIL